DDNDAFCKRQRTRLRDWTNYQLTSSARPPNFLPLRVLQALLRQLLLIIRPISQPRALAFAKRVIVVGDVLLFARIAVQIKEQVALHLVIPDVLELSFAHADVAA